MTVNGNKVPFEEALTMTGYSRYNMLLCLVCVCSMFAMTFELFSVSYLVPASACELNTNSTQQGLLACVPFVGVIATAHIWGYLADTRGRRRTIIISMTMGYVVGSGAAFSPNWIVLCVFKIISSGSVSGASAIAMTLLSECIPIAKRSSLVMMITGIYLASSGVMAVLAIPVLPLTFSYHIPFLGIYFNSWRVLNLIFAVPCALSAIGSFYVYESPKYLLNVGQDEKAIEVLRGMFVMNTGKTADNYKVDAVDLGEKTSSSLHKGFWTSILAQTVPMVKPPLLKHTALLALLVFISYISMNTFFVWMPFIVNAFMVSVVEGERHHTICEMIRHSANSTSVEETHDCSLNSVAMTLVFGISMVLSFWTIFMGRLINCVGRKRLFIGIQMIAAVAALVINISPFWILSAILFMIFMSAILSFGLLNTYCVDIFPTYLKAMAISLTKLVGRGSAVIGINVLKRLLDTNCEAAFYIFGSITLAGGLVGFLLSSDEKIKKQNKPSMLKENT